MDRAEGTGSKQAALLARWLDPAPPGAGPRVDPRALFADVEAALLASFKPPLGPEAVAGLLEPIKKALEVPEAERDPAALGGAFEIVEDVLEAAALAARLTR